MGLLFTRYGDRTTQAAPYPQKVTINQPAPPEQLRLLKDCRDEIVRDLVVGHAPNNHLDFSVVVLPRACPPGREARVAMRLNGKDVSFSVGTLEDSDRLAGPAYQDILEAVAERVAGEIMRAILPHIMRGEEG